MRRIQSLIQSIALLSLVASSSGSVIVQGETAPLAFQKQILILGTVYDSTTLKPIPFVTVQVTGTTRTALTNESGQYRLVVIEDSVRLKFSHVAYYPVQIMAGRADSATALDVYLHPNVIEIPGMRVYGRQYEPGEQIIVEAIRRKKDILAKLKQFSCDAYTKMVIRDAKKPDSINVFLITETQVSCFWESPDKYKEIIRARKQSANLKAEENLVAVGQILNFNENRIGPGIVSPTAEDALKYYRYFLLDTIEVDSQRVFVLEVEAKNDVDPLFKGTIQIADSSYDVVAVDVGFNKGLPQSVVKNHQFRQRCARFSGGIWMPVEVQFAADIELGIPLPGIPSKMSATYAASLHSYSFTRHERADLFDEFVFEVDPLADKLDSSMWQRSQVIPLTAEEIGGYRRIDSIKHASRPVYGRLPTVLLGATLVAAMSHDLFHFNRVEGAYVGLGGRKRDIFPGTDLRFKSGYAIDAEFWEHAYGITYHASGRARMDVGIEWHDAVRHRPLGVSRTESNSTIPALLTKRDPLDYFGERGYTVNLSTTWIRRTRFGVSFTDTRQWSLPKVTDFSFVEDEGETARSNPAVLNGKLRSVAAEFRYDSRPLIRNKSRIETIRESEYTLMTARVEYASPRFVSTDFDFRQYSIAFFTRQRLLGLGFTSIQVEWGGSDRVLPPQRYFTLTGRALQMSSTHGFQTLDTFHFSGSRMLSVTAQHDFGKRFFGKSGIPLVRGIPFTVAIHGGAFWTDFAGSVRTRDDERARSAHHAYSELGFSVGNLAPRLGILNMQLGFTWQLSDFPTDKFALRWDIGF